MSQPQILMVEDSPEVVLIVRMQGQRGGFTVRHYADGEGAWEHLESIRGDHVQAPDLILLDYQLPRHTGPVWCQRIRAIPTWDHIPIALFSSWDLESKMAIALEAGADHLFAKDLILQREGLRNRLDEILLPAAARRSLLTVDGVDQPSGERSVAEWVQAFDQALNHPSVRILGRAVLHVLCHRAAHRLQLSSDNALDFAGVPATDRAALAAAFVEQVACVLGIAGSAPFRSALAAALAPNAGVPVSP